MNSSRRISPGWIGGYIISGTFMLLSVIVNEFHIVDITAVPGKAQSPITEDIY